MEGQHNPYQYMEQSKPAMDSSGNVIGDVDPWGKAPPFQYGSPLNSLEDIPNFTKTYHAMPEHNHMNISGQVNGSSMGEHGQNKKRRIDPQDHLQSYTPHYGHYQSSSNSTSNHLGRLPTFTEPGQSSSNASIDANNGAHNSYDAEDSDPSDPNDPKRRKVQRACDLCRRKKIRCDGAHSSRRNKKCSNCVESKTDCTYVEAAKRRGPPLGYIETLEWKVSKLEALAQKVSECQGESRGSRRARLTHCRGDLLYQLKPSIDMTSEVGPSISRDTFDLDLFKMALLSLDIPYNPPSSRSKGSRAAASKDANSQRSRKSGKDVQETAEVGTAAVQTAGSGIPKGETWEDVKAACHQNMQISVMGSDLQHPSSKSTDMIGWSTPEVPKNNTAPTPTKEEEQEHEEKEEAETQKFVDQLACQNPSEGYRYLGKSCELDVKNSCEAVPISLIWMHLVAGVQFLRSALDYKAAMAGENVGGADSRRLRYWALPIWEASTAEHNGTSIDLSRWPKPELAQALIDAYFQHDNITLPLLNRIIFQKDFDKGRWKKDISFAQVCLLLFAVGSRHIEHPDVYWHAGDEAAGRAAMADMEMYRHSAGWRWMEAVVKTGKSFLKPATLEDLQIVTVSTISRIGWHASLMLMPLSCYSYVPSSPCEAQSSPRYGQ
jgi:hypothetical protein